MNYTNNINKNLKERKYKVVVCKHCGISFIPTHHSNSVCSDKCRIQSRQKTVSNYRFRRKKVGIVYMNCQRCGIRLQRKGNMQKYCGNRKIKTSCSYLVYRQHLVKNKEEYSKTPVHFLNMYRGGARRRGYEFNLTLEDLKLFWHKPCYYCGTKIDFIGMDRIDNTKGYILGNIVSCCWLCNEMKKAHTYHLFISQCIKIADKHRKMTEGVDQETKDILEQEELQRLGYEVGVDSQVDKFKTL